MTSTYHAEFARLGRLSRKDSSATKAEVDAQRAVVQLAWRRHVIDKLIAQIEGDAAAISAEQREQLGRLATASAA